MPSHGMTITKITHSVLAPPPRSLLRKMSPRIQNRHMNQAKNRKNSNKASRNEPLLSNIGTSHGPIRWMPPVYGHSLMRSPADGSPRPGGELGEEYTRGLANSLRA